MTVHKSEFGLERVVYKYTLPLEDGTWQNIFMPAGAEIIHVGTQGRDVCLWAIISPLEEKEERHFEIIATGAKFNPGGGKYLGSVQLLNDQGHLVVLHIFERRMQTDLS